VLLSINQGKGRSFPPDVVVVAPLIVLL